MSLVVDTDVVSFLFKKDTRARHYRMHLLEEECILSFMTLAELQAWGIRHRWGQARKDALDRYLNRFHVSYVNKTLCLLWAEVSEQARSKGLIIQAADAWIAATAIALNLPLLTNDPADFTGVNRLRVITE